MKKRRGMVYHGMNGWRVYPKGHNKYNPTEGVSGTRKLWDGSATLRRKADAAIEALPVRGDLSKIGE